MLCKHVEPKRMKPLKQKGVNHNILVIACHISQYIGNHYNIMLTHHAITNRNFFKFFFFFFSSFFCFFYGKCTNRSWRISRKAQPQLKYIMSNAHLDYRHPLQSAPQLRPQPPPMIRTTDASLPRRLRSNLRQTIPRQRLCTGQFPSCSPESFHSKSCLL